MRYAFVRMHRRISPGVGLEETQPRNIEVYSVDGFLRAMAPNIDVASVEKKLEVMAGVLAKGQPRLELGMLWLSVLDEDEAYAILKDFLMDDSALTKHRNGWGGTV